MISEVKEKMEDLEYIRDVFTHLEDAEGISFNYYIGVLNEEVNHQLLPCSNNDYSIKFLKKNGNQFNVYRSILFLCGLAALIINHKKN